MHGSTHQPIEPDIRVVIEDPDQNLCPNPESDREWAMRCEENPHYFDGPILAFTRFEPETNRVFARIDSYKRFATRACFADNPVTILSITGIFMRTGVDRRDFALVGKRGMSTHSYPGLWEFGPSGGIDPPETSTRILDRDDMRTQLAREAHEEAGIALTPHDACTPIAITHDPVAGAFDIVLVARINHDPSADTGWEYDETRWVTRDELRGWITREPGVFIPPTLELALADLPFEQ